MQNTCIAIHPKDKTLCGKNTLPGIQYCKRHEYMKEGIKCQWKGKNNRECESFIKKGETMCGPHQKKKKILPTTSSTPATEKASASADLDNFYATPPPPSPVHPEATNLFECDSPSLDDDFTRDLSAQFMDDDDCIFPDSPNFSTMMMDNDMIPTMGHDLPTTATTTAAATTTTLDPSPPSGEVSFMINDTEVRILNSKVARIQILFRGEAIVEIVPPPTKKHKSS
jgi:hypothetical protein